MRDLDRIEERDPNDRRGSLGRVALGLVILLAVSGVVGMVAGRAAQAPVAIPSRDPLAALDSPAALAVKERRTPRSFEVNRTALQFPQTLTGKEERPEVLAALAAADQEIAIMADSALDGDSHTDTAHRLSRTMPAATAAGPAKRALLRRAPTDPLIEAAIPEPRPAGPPAPEGVQGRYVLQVLSYERESDAQAFAAALRDKGHRAFVTTADVPERGRYFRVRIGPFDTVYDANRYRALFEQAEQMNTFVVHAAAN